MAVALTTDPSGARFPRTNTIVLARPVAAGRVGVHDDVVGVDAVGSAQALASAPRDVRSTPTSRARRRASRR